MKEKRIDIYLAKASSYFLLLVGFGGAFLNEILQDEPRMIVVITAFIFCLIVTASVVRLYAKAEALSKKSKKRSL